MSEVRWERPGPGTWKFDAAHCNHPLGRFFHSIYADAFEQGFAEGFEFVGAPLETVRHATINGWPFTSPQPIGGPAEAKGPPPKLLLTLLFAIVPSLRERTRRAEGLFAERPWRPLWDEWDESLAPRIARELDAEVRRIPADLDDAALATVLRDLAAHARRCLHRHFRNSAITAVTQGDYLVHCRRWAAVDAAEAARALAGFSDATQGPLDSYARIVEALAKDGALSVLNGESADLAERIASRSPTARRYLDAYLAEYGLHAVNGISVYDAVLEERPEIWHAALRARVAADTRADESARTRAASQDVAAGIRERVPRAHRSAWDEMLADARRAGAVREADVHLVARALGLCRRAMAEVGQRLVDRGRASERESAFDLTVQDAIAFLAGRGPSEAEIRRHTDERKGQARLRPPRFVGPPPQPPPIDRFPLAVARVVEASMAFLSRFEAEGDPIIGQGLAGHGVSRGVVEGVARVVRGPDDFERFRAGDILVARTTAAMFNVVLASASGVVTEIGGLVCHAAICAREFDIPGVVGVKGVLDAVPDGALVRVDGGAGTVTVLTQRAEVTPVSEQRSALPPSAKPRLRETPGELVTLDAARDRARFGGKACQLAELVAAAVAVPEGLALDAAFVEAIAAGDGVHRERLAHALAGIAGPWAVRSSCSSEDGYDSSYAGQFLTILGVSDLSTCGDAIGRVWASADGAGVRAYRRRMGLSGAMEMAVVVQRLVDAAVAGVLFGTSSGGHVVEASWGLGEAVVSGTVDPDRFTVSAAGMVVTEQVADKPTELRFDPSAGVVTRVVPASRRREPCLDREQLLALTQLAARCREWFGAPRDIEWAIDADRRLLCLQARPITRALTVE
ncbi:MAG: PEP/pyruvate-binding domain-containing protein [Polyangiaceae bacterium]